MEVNRIIQGDAVRVLKTFPDKCVDLIITSPPYDNLRDYDGYSFDFEGIAGELYRVIKEGGVIVWVVGDSIIDGSESGTSFRQALFFKELGLRLHDTMIYEKNGASYPEQKRYYQIFEYMFVFSKGEPKTINLLSDRKNKWSSSWGKRSTRGKDGKLKQKGKLENLKEYGVRFNIWRYSTGAGFSTKDEIAFEHPAIFPEQLAADHIRSWSNEGDLVLDPMNGSGTTTKIAQTLNRKFIGIDVSEKYCKIAEKRLAQKPIL